MARPEPLDEQKGQQLLTAVERLVASNESLKAVVAGCVAEAKARGPSLEGDSLREAAAEALVRHFSTRAAIAGGAASVPALIPGWGTLVSLVGGTVAELTFLLKWEVEMSLCLSHLYGFDIESRQERQIAFLLASVGTYDTSGKSFFGDVVKAEGVAMWNYGPRVIGGWLLKAMSAVALMWVWRGFVKLVPVLGIAIGSSINKVLTQKVGERCRRDLRTRRDMLGNSARPAPRSAAPKKSPARKKTPAPKKAAGGKKVGPVKASAKQKQPGPRVDPADELVN